MDKQIIALLSYSGRMEVTGIARALRVDAHDAWAALSRLAEHGKIVRHADLFTGRQTYSA